MDRIFKHRWQTVLFFATLAGIVYGVFYSAYRGPMAQRVQRRIDQAMRRSEQPPPKPIQKGRIVLSPNQPLTVDNKRLVFSGIENDQLIIAVFMLELDPQVPYYHRVPIREARQRFQLGGQAFKLVAYDEKGITLRARSRAY
jgi:hypothetical protein